LRLRPRLRIALLLVLAAELVATGVIGSMRFAPPSALAWSTLRNATYPTSLALRTVTLRDGIFDAEAAPGSAARTIVRLVDLAAFGDLDGDGVPDAAVVLVTTSGGTGVFVDLVAVRNSSGVPVPLSRTLLGDRVLVREVRIDDRHIVVRLRTRGAADPLARLTQEITQTYALEAGALVLQAETRADVPLSSADDFVYRPERIELAPGLSRSLQGSLPPGQIASYVVHGEPGQTLELQARSLFNNAVLSVSGLSDGLTLVSRQEYAVDRTLLLPSAQDYAVRLVSVSGQTLPFILDMRLRAAQRSPEPTAPPAVPLPPTTPRPIESLPPSGVLVDRSLGQLSDPALGFARSRPPIVGVAVVIPGSRAVYTQNADEQVPTASVVKVLVMLVVLERARQERRPVTEGELALLWPMITESDNDATSQLWEDIGRGQAVASYLRSVGVSGFTPDPGTSWGVSFASARAMATVLGKVIAGEILDEPSRALALRLLDGVIASQRWGIPTGTDAAGDRVGVKNGWYPGEEGWRVNSVGVVRPSGGTPYAIAVMTDGRVSWREGIETIEGIAAKVHPAARMPQ
jgi:hypothetical protein